MLGYGNLAWLYTSVDHPADAKENLFQQAAQHKAEDSGLPLRPTRPCPPRRRRGEWSAKNCSDRGKTRNDHSTADEGAFVLGLFRVTWSRPKKVALMQRTWLSRRISGRVQGYTKRRKHRGKRFSVTSRPANKSADPH